MLKSDAIKTEEVFLMQKLKKIDIHVHSVPERFLLQRDGGIRNVERIPGGDHQIFGHGAVGVKAQRPMGPAERYQAGLAQLTGATVIAGWDGEDPITRLEAAGITAGLRYLSHIFVAQGNRGDGLPFVADGVDIAAADSGSENTDLQLTVSGDGLRDIPQFHILCTRGEFDQGFHDTASRKAADTAKWAGEVRWTETMITYRLSIIKY